MVMEVGIVKSVPNSAVLDELTSRGLSLIHIYGFKAFKDNISVRSCLSYTYSLTGGSGKDIKDEPLTAKVTRCLLYTSLLLCGSM